MATIRFARKRKVKVFMKVQEYEKENVWWQQSELRKMRAQCWSMARSERPPSIADSLCLRGLEDLSQEAFVERRRRMRNSILTVLREQENLKDAGINDPSILASKYQAITKDSVSNARWRGKEDEEDLIWINAEEVVKPSSSSSLMSGCSSTKRPHPKDSPKTILKLKSTTILKRRSLTYGPL